MPLVLANNLSKLKPEVSPKAWDLNETPFVVLVLLMDAARSRGGAGGEGGGTGASAGCD